MTRTPWLLQHRNPRWTRVRTSRHHIHLLGQRTTPYVWKPGDEVVALFAALGAFSGDQADAMSTHLRTFVSTFGPLLADEHVASRAGPHREPLEVLVAHARNISRVATLASGSHRAVRQELETWAKQWKTPKKRDWVGPALDDLDVKLAPVPQLAQLKTLPDRKLTGLADQVITATLKSNLYGTERLWARHGATPVFEASHLLGAIYWTLVDQLALDQVFRCEECGRRFPSSRKRRFCPHFPKHANSPCAVRAAQRRFRRRSGRSRSPR